MITVIKSGNLFHYCYYFLIKVIRYSFWASEHTLIVINVTLDQCPYSDPSIVLGMHSLKLTLLTISM